MILYILSKYWRKHIKSALALVFSGVLLTAIIFVMLMTERENVSTRYHSMFDTFGRAEVIIANSDDETLAKATQGKSGYNYGIMQVYGEFGGFAYAAINDEHNIWHIPLSEGKMPETADEIAADRGALNALFWAGKCGDTIELDGKTYTVVGIIDEKYGKNREGSPLCDFNGEASKNSHYKIPLIFVGEYDSAPIYRIDMINGFFDLGKGLDDIHEYSDYLNNAIGFENQWHYIVSEKNLPELKSQNHPEFFLAISFIGVIISALSVFSVLRNIFAERKNTVSILKRIGFKNRSVIRLYAAECAVFTAVQAVLGIAAGVLAYQGIFAFKTEIIGEKAYSGFTDVYSVYANTFDPFLFSVILPLIIIITAYILCIATDKVRIDIQPKNAEPKPLSKCFSRSFSNKAVTITQTAALTLICFAVLLGYMFYTDNGKALTDRVGYVPPSGISTADGLDMEENNIAEYYSCEMPTVNFIGEENSYFPFAVDNFSAGIDDNTADILPDFAIPTGTLTQTFVAGNNFINEIDTSSEDFRQGLLALSGGEYQNFFEDGQPGSMQLYRIETKLTSVKVIESLSDMVTEGELNIEKLNSGEEIVVAYKGVKPPFKAGETVLLNSVKAAETGYGIGGINSAEVKIGALLKINPKNDEVKNSAVRNKDDYNFLTTAEGASAMGLHCAKYTKIYAREPMDGGIIPSAAQMKMQSLKQMQHDYFVNQLIKYSSSIAILLVMSLLGFSAYFNGIGMKIRLKKYEISVLRAVGMNIKNLRKELLLNSIKIPLISSASAYVLAKIVQLENWAGLVLIQIMNNDHQNKSDLFIPVLKFVESKLYIDSLMWQANAEIPALILFAVICAVTLLLTVIALRKFKSNIAGDLSEGRTRQ